MPAFLLQHVIILVQMVTGHLSKGSFVQIPKFDANPNTNPNPDPNLNPMPIRFGQTTL